MDWVKHWDLMRVKADMLVVYMQLNPPQPHLKRIMAVLQQCCKDRPSVVMTLTGGVYVVVHQAVTDYYIGETHSSHSGPGGAPIVCARVVNHNSYLADSYAGMACT